MAYNMPAIIHRLESSLIVLEECHKLGLPIRPDLALEAMTKDSGNTEEHSVEQVNFQGGMGNNYERLEFLGDAFLKMSTSIALYAVAPEGNEFDYHVSRMVLICNKNLFNNALELGLEESIRSKSFDRRVWYPEGLEQLRGKKGTSKTKHVLGDKSIADVCEALIGAAYLTGKDQNNLNMAVQAVTKLSNHKLENQDHTMQTWDELYAAFKIPEWQAAAPTAVHLHLAEHIKDQMGYSFTHPRLLRCAFIHPSYSFMYERIPHYQRLEFLGDALLDMVCVDYLYHRFPGADPQWLTEHKMAMVSNQFLGCVCVSLGFQRHMISMTGGLQQQITSYVEAVTHARECAKEKAVAASQARSAYARDFWTTVIEPPKCLPDIVEAYIGAVFVDSGFDYTQVERFFQQHILPYFEDMHLYDTFANKHPVTFLANSLQLHFGCADWSVMVREVYVPPDDMAAEEEDTRGNHRSHRSVTTSRVTEPQVVGVIMVHGAVRAHALASSGRYAKVAAAEKMAAVLADMAVADFKRLYRCDCTPEDVAQADPLAHATAA
jgi:endoribonuclease Dicer